MTQYGVGLMNLTVESKTCCGNISVPLCQSKKKQYLYVLYKKKENTILLYTYVTGIYIRGSQHEMVHKQVVYNLP